MNVSWDRKTRFALRASLELFALIDPILLLIEGMLLFVFLLPVVATVPSPMVGALVVTFFVLLFQTGVLAGIRRNWRYVPFTAVLIATKSYPEFELERHLKFLRRFLRIELGEYCDDLLLAVSQDLEHLRSDESRAAALDQLTRGVALDLHQQLADAPARDRESVGNKYAAKVMEFFTKADAPVAAARDFLISYFEKMDDNLKLRAAKWAPPDTFLQRIEKHPTMLQAIWLIVRIFLFVVGLVLVLYFGIPILRP